MHTPSRRSVIAAATSVATAAIVLPAANSDAAYTPTLRYGNTGTQVRRLQAALSGAGYWLGAVDGSYGALTVQAVYAVQKAMGYSRTGVADARVWNAALANRRPGARYGGATHIEIDLARQLLMVVQSGRVVVALNTSTGSGERFMYNGRVAYATTPRGTFRIFRKQSYGWVTGSLGSMYKPFYFTANGHAIHGSSSIPPYPASHGCARLSTAAQNMLISRGFEFVGETIRIY